MLFTRKSLLIATTASIAVLSFGILQVRGGECFRGQACRVGCDGLSDTFCSLYNNTEGGQVCCQLGQGSQTTSCTNFRRSYLICAVAVAPDKPGYNTANDKRVCEERRSCALTPGPPPTGPGETVSYTCNTTFWTVFSKRDQNRGHC